MIKTLNSQLSTFNSSGQTLLEVLAALGVGVVVLVAIVSAVLSSLSNAQFSKNQNLATQYGQQGMEIVRSIKNNSWSSFYNTYTGTSITPFCLPKDDTTPNSGLCQPGDKIDGFFTRELRFERGCIVSPCNTTNPDDPNLKIQVKATVSFTDSKGTHQSELISYFTNWRQ